MIEIYGMEACVLLYLELIIELLAIAKYTYTDLLIKYLCACEECVPKVNFK